MPEKSAEQVVDPWAKQYHNTLKLPGCPWKTLLYELLVHFWTVHFGLSA